jgi:3-hydroxyacyl-CoA dehydrogenase/enoyl-CoA hydratase/3-hydroxybutyryl-CoA epimerase
MGPLRLADMVNLDLAVKIADQTKADLGDGYTEHPGIAAARRLVKLGRIGEKAGKGFYDHGSETRLWPELAKEFPRAEAQPLVDDVKARLMAIQALETLRCIDDGVVKTPEDADLGSIMGWGFPPHTGGVATYIDQTGPANMLTLADRLSRAHGARFAPPERLKQLVQDKALLYSGAAA